MLTDPLILLGPRSSPRAYQELHRYIMELRPIELTTGRGWADFCLYLLLPLIALMAWDMRAVPQKTQDAARWRIVVWPALAMTLLGVRYIRFLIYAGCVAAPLLLVQLAKLKPRRKIKAALALALLPFALGALTSSLVPVSKTATPAPSCHLRDAMASIQQLQEQLGHLPVIMAPINHAPELLWRSEARIIGSSYYRNEPGVFDTHDFFRDSTADFSTARAIATRRGVDAVLLCADDDIPELQESGLLKQLQQGVLPPWLEKSENAAEWPILLKIKAD